MTDIPRGRFVWYDLLTSDPEAAVSFYTRLLGWDTRVWAGGKVPYTMWTLQETPIGGVVRLPENVGASPFWLAFVTTPDTEATCKRIVERQGSVIHGPLEVPTVGRFAHVSDPQGAIQAVFTPASAPPGLESPPVPGQFCWHELVTSDHEAAFNYYADLFGWQKGEAMDMGEMGCYQTFQREGIPLGGMFNHPADDPGPPFWLYYVKVRDVEESVGEVSDLGGKILNGPMEVPGGDRVAQCMDPQGAAFALHSSPE